MAENQTKGATGSRTLRRGEKPNYKENQTSDEENDAGNPEVLRSQTEGMSTSTPPPANPLPPQRQTSKGKTESPPEWFTEWFTEFTKSIDNRFLQLNARFNHMEASNSSEINKLDEKLQANSDELEKLRNKLNSGKLTVKEDITAVKEDITAVKEDITAVKEDITAVKENITAVKENITAVKEDITAVKEEITAVKEEITAVKDECVKKNGETTEDTENIKKKLEHQEAETVKLNAELIKTKSESYARNAEYDRKERKAAELEAERTAENIILSGNSIPRHQNGEDIVNVALQTLKNNIRVIVNKSDIASAYRPKRKSQNEYVYEDKIVVKFHSKPTKRDIVHSNLAIRPSGLFINEQLTKTVDELYFHLRKMKKEHPGKIAVLHTRDGIIRVRKTREGSSFNILTVQDLDKFTRDVQLPNPLSQDIE